MDRMNFADSFDLTNGSDILRIVCGLFLIPHLFVKFQSQEFVKGFMVKAGLRPPVAWLYVAFAVEIVASIGLVFDLYTFYVAVLAGVFLLDAA
jgi:putative oxidoreductase